MLLAGVFSSLCPAYASAMESAAAERGHDLVSDNCLRCHAIDRVAESALSAAPPLRDLHRRYDVEFLMEALVEGITTAHSEMPEFQFTPADASAIVAYLKSLEEADATR
jgi:mono/diheme cytochrome c family protein